MKASTAFNEGLEKSNPDHPEILKRSIVQNFYYQLNGVTQENARLRRAKFLQIHIRKIDYFRAKRELMITEETACLKLYSETMTLRLLGM